MAIPPIFRMPNELWDGVFGKLDSSDQLHIALSCKRLTDVALRYIYHSLTFKIPEGAGAAEKVLQPFFACTDKALGHVRDISVVNAPFRHPPGSSGIVTPHTLREESQSTINLNRDLKRLILRFPDHNLKSFNFSHRFGIERGTLALLFRSHHKSLRELGISTIWDLEFLDYTWPQICPRYLLKLDWRSIHSAQCTPGLHILLGNHLKLQELTVGRQDEIFDTYRADDPRSNPGWARKFHKAIRLSDLLHGGVATREVPYPQLRTLRVIGLVLELADNSIPFGHLHRLALESCGGSEKFLADIVRTQAFHKGDKTLTSAISFPNLKEFVFRHEKPTESLKDSLKRFLSSISGLKVLSILLDNVREMIHPECFTKTHGSTLEVLVFEGRSSPRNSLARETSLYLGGRNDPQSQISAIFSLCPRLRELSIPMQWRDPFGTFLGPTTNTQRPFEIPHLSTLHIRNAPPWAVSPLPSYNPSNPNKDSTPRLRYDDLESYFETLVLSLDCEDLGNLSVVAVGPTTFSDTRWLPHPRSLRVPTNCQDMWKHIVFYAPSVVSDRKGRKRVLLAELGTAMSLEEAKKDFPEGCWRCFESYWLK